MLRRVLVVLRRLLEVALVALLLWYGLSLRARIGQGFVFAGSDSYGYNKLADELREHGRYALGPEPEPLAWVRPPLYPLYVAMVKRDAKAEMSGGEGWERIKRANVWLEVVGTGLLIFFAARRMAGPVAGLGALALLMLLPFNALATPAALTETLATFLTMALGTVLVYLAHDGERRHPGWFAVGGGLLALGVLTRPDALLLAPAFLVPVLRFAGWRRRGLAIALTAAGFLLVFSPWPVRNLVRFGEPHLLGGRIDRYSRPVVHYHGSWAWMRSFAKDWQPMTALTTCIYDQRCYPPLWLFDAEGAFDSRAERAEVGRLLDLRWHEGHSAAVSAGFQRVADARRRAQPLRTEVKLPLSRFFAMWIADHDELVPDHSPVAKYREWLKPISFYVFCATWLGALACCALRSTRAAGFVLGIAVYGRTAILAYTFYSMPRYLLEVLPLAYCLIAAGLVATLAALLALLRDAAVYVLRRASASRKRMSGVESASMKI